MGTGANGPVAEKYLRGQSSLAGALLSCLEAQGARGMAIQGFPFERRGFAYRPLLVSRQALKLFLGSV